MEKPVSPRREYLNNLSSIILNAAISVHREMGPGLLEGVYAVYVQGITKQKSDCVINGSRVSQVQGCVTQ